MSAQDFIDDQVQSPGNSAASTSAPSPAPVSAVATETLDAVEDIDFLLEEIENKIAPLALA